MSVVCVVLMCFVIVLFKLLIMSVSNLLINLFVGNSGGMKFFS